MADLEAGIITGSTGSSSRFFPFFLRFFFSTGLCSIVAAMLSSIVSTVLRVYFWIPQFWAEADGLNKLLLFCASSACSISAVSTCY